MDLITPAQTWAAREKIERDNDAARIESDHEHHMPWPQAVTMFVSVVGPIVGLILAIVLLWHRDGEIRVGWPEIVSLVGLYVLCGFGVTIGYHRLFTHRSFETSRALRLLLALFGSMAGQGQLIRWCATHRRHHQSSDHEGDPHSPHLHGDSAIGFLRGVWHAHMGWLFQKDCPDTARSVPDLLADPMMVLIDKLYFPLVFIGILIPGAIIGLATQSWYGFLSGVVWGGLVRICLLQHVTWSINSVCHVWGSRPFRTTDHSANNWIFAVLALGEGWHNNHHAFPTSARQGLRWYQFDSSWILIRAMKALGLIWNIRTPSPAALNTKLQTN